MTRKYIVVNGQMTLNPEYKEEVGQASPPAPQPVATVTTQPGAIVVMTSLAQMQNAQVTLAPQFHETFEQLHSDEYLKEFKGANVNSNDLVTGMTQAFERFEIPLGLMSKVAALKRKKMHFKVDNSGSMEEPSNLPCAEASTYMADYIRGRGGFLTRWEEAEDRLHRMIDLLAYVPTGQIVVSLFDHQEHYGTRPESWQEFDRTGKTPEEFKAYCHDKINNLFTKNSPGGNTPIYINMKNMISEAEKTRGSTDVCTNHYLLSDGEPSGGSSEVDRVKNLLENKDPSCPRDPKTNAFTFLGCSNMHVDYEWMHEIEEVAPFVAALPDYKEERQQVKQDQGDAFPYSRGFWLLCCLAAANNPDDLDDLDQLPPFTKKTLETLFGHTLSDDEYLRYFRAHPSRVFQADEKLFMTVNLATDIEAVRIFRNTLKKDLDRDMDNGEDDDEDRDDADAKNAVRSYYANRDRQDRYTTSAASLTSYSGATFAQTSNQASNRVQQTQVQQVQQEQPASCCCTIM